jgi:hypothetical protein
MALGVSIPRAVGGEPSYLLSGEIDRRFSDAKSEAGVTQPACSACKASPVEQLIARGFGEGTRRFKESLAARRVMVGSFHVSLTEDNLNLWPEEIVSTPPTEIEQLLESGFPTNRRYKLETRLREESYDNSFAFGGYAFSR